MNTYFFNLSKGLVDELPTREQFVADLNVNFQSIFLKKIARLVIFDLVKNLNWSILNLANNHLFKVNITLEKGVKYAQY